jgi:hypothetical protein
LIVHVVLVDAGLEGRDDGRLAGFDLDEELAILVLKGLQILLQSGDAALAVASVVLVALVDIQLLELCQRRALY